MQGRGEEGVALIEQGLDSGRTTGAVLFRTWFLSFLAEACRTTKRCEKGLTALTEAIATMEKTGERFLEAELYRLRGELLLIEDALTTSEAERSFREAIEIARRQSAKSLELRATTSLARLTAKQGNRDEARPMLAAIYGVYLEIWQTPLMTLREEAAAMSTIKLIQMYASPWAERVSAGLQKDLIRKTCERRRRSLTSCHRKAQHNPRKGKGERIAGRSSSKAYRMKNKNTAPGWTKNP
jgi:hypothetical protein